MKDFITKEIQDSYNVKEIILKDKNIIETICKISEKAVNAYKNGNKILIAGNGGSAADAQHIAGELVSRFYFDRDGLPALALTTDTSILTAIGNDYGYENLFARQVQANGVKGDILIGISTSGNSPNIIKAIEEARKKELTVVGLTGSNPSKMDELCDYIIKVPSTITPRIQETHILVGHIVCGIIEKELFTPQG